MQLHELIPVETPLGHGHAIFVELMPHDNWWTVALQNGAVVTFAQERIRVCKSYTHGRVIDDAQMREITREEKPRT